MSQLYKCDFCGTVCENLDGIYQLESVPVNKIFYQDVDPRIGKHICRACVDSMKTHTIRVVPGK